MRRILITGASRGLGRALAERFAGEGAEVIALSSSGVAPDGAISLRVDLSDLPAVRAMAARIRDRFPSLDIFIHNAGISPAARLLNAHEADFDRSLAVNFIAGRLFAEGLSDRLRGGLILFILSRVGFEGRIGLCAYAASKGLLAGYVTGAAPGLLREGVRILGVNPGFMRTAMVSDAVAQAQAAASLLHAAPPPEIAARAIAGLCGQSWGTGHCVDLDSRVYQEWGR